MSEREPGTRIYVGWSWPPRLTRRQVKMLLPALLTFVLAFFVVAGPLADLLVHRSFVCINRDMC